MSDLRNRAGESSTCFPRKAPLCYAVKAHPVGRLSPREGNLFAEEGRRSRRRDRLSPADGTEKRTWWDGRLRKSVSSRICAERMKARERLAQGRAASADRNVGVCRKACESIAYYHLVSKEKSS